MWSSHVLTNQRGVSNGLILVHGMITKSVQSLALEVHEYLLYQI